MVFKIQSRVPQSYKEVRPLVIRANLRDTETVILIFAQLEIAFAHLAGNLLGALTLNFNYIILCLQ